MATRATLHFHSVGQGLFSTGTLYREQEFPLSRHDYTWVYDCGTSSSQALLDTAITNYRSGFPAEPVKPKLNLVVVSHFDRDHVSGLVRLLNNFKVKDLLLPYLPLWQRLVIAFAENRGLGSALTRFVLDPVEFIAQQPGAEVERILFSVNGTEPPSLPDEQPEQPSDGPLGPDSQRHETESQRRIGEPSDVETDDNGRLTASIHRAPMPAEEQISRRSDAVARAIQKRNLQIEYIESLQVAHAWEFVPYNDSQLASRFNLSFKNAVAKMRDELIGATSSKDRKDALTKLKKKYESITKPGFERNVISLFLLVRTLRRGRRGWMVRQSYSNTSLGRWEVGYRRTLTDGCAVLYTGDGFLEKKHRFDELKRYLRPARLENLTVLQVMHHGSHRNWYPGLAEELRPHISVFSSQPDRAHKHPDAEVVRDFLRYGVRQVDDSNDLVIQFSQ